MILARVVLGGLAAAAAAAPFLRRRNVDLIVRDSLRRRPVSTESPRHVFFSLVDHFEPFWKNDDPRVALDRVRRWRERYPEVAARFHDRGGRPPRHAFFYPAEDYDRLPDCVSMLSEIVRAGAGDVEVHLHHDHDTSHAMRARLLEFTRVLRERHGLLREVNGRVVYGFIHGNWVLGNSGRDGAGCGVDDELRVLEETGCYADFTLPSAPHPSQPAVMNRIYYAGGDRSRPRAHFRAIDARFGVAGAAGPLIVTGPLALNWKRRRRGILPAIENGDLTGLNPPAPDRADAWVRAGIGVAGFPRWVFVKTHTHGAQERNSARLLGDGAGSLPALFADLLARYDDGRRFVLHFVTPWEMAGAVRVLESGDRAAIDAVERFDYPF
ncbi:MAG TPA: hypothetical protein VF247_11995 [Candidatus Krumholzibacteria bacterium]